MDRPTEGVDTTATVTVANGLERDLSNIAVSLDGIDVEESRRVASRLTAGETATFQFSFTPDASGETAVSATVRYVLDSGFERTVTETETVTVKAAFRPQVTLDTTRPVVGVRTDATVTIANGLDRDLRNLAVTLEGVPTEQPSRVASQLAAGTDRTFTFGITPRDAGERDVTILLEYAFADGSTRSTRINTSIDVEPLHDRLVIDPTKTNSGIDVTVSNLGNAPVEDVVVSGDADDSTIGRGTIATLAPKESKTVTLPVTRDATDDTTVAVSATYTLPGQRSYEGVTAVESVQYQPTVPGNIQLTGVDVEVESDGRLRITGSASNVGLTAVNSVIVGVDDVDGVEPAGPNREYFVGTVPPSDFVSFDVFASVDDGVDVVPLTVTYLVDGERKSASVDVPVGTVEPPETEERFPWVPAGVGGLVVIAVVAIVVVSWRRSRGDT